MDITFIGPIVGGALALGGTAYLAFSANKRDSVAAAERQLQAWHKIARSPVRSEALMKTFEVVRPSIRLVRVHRTGPVPIWR